MKNLKTTITGMVLGGGISIDALLNQGLTHGWKHALFGLGIAILGLLCKDHDVTGGTR